jgi:DNA-binding GntR family transcriptional regulator
LVRAAPAREQIVKDVEQRIDGGELRPGDAIGSESEFGERYGVARGTVRSALLELADRGRIESVPGKGWFVAGAAAKRDVASVADELRRDLKSGRHSAGMPFLSEKELGELYGLTRYAAKSVFAALEADGLITAVHGKGRFVAER